MAVALSYKLPLMPADSSQPARPAEFRFHLLLLLAAILLGSFLQLRGPAWVQDIFAQVRLDSPASLFLLLAALLASIVAHELGHLAAALFLNYEFLGATLGPFQLEWSHNQGRLRFKPSHWLQCSISAVPREMPAAWRARMMFVVAAGPFVSLLALLITAALSLAAIGTPTLDAFWSACAEVNFFLFTLGLLPNSRFAKVRNDAALFLALCKNAADAADIFICHQAIELSLRRIRPEDYPQPLLLDLVAFEGRPYTRLAVARRMIEWAVDSGHIALASEWDQAAVAVGNQCGAHLANAALAESACFDVVFRDDPAAAARKFAQVQFKSLFPASLAERARAAHFLVSGSPQLAGRHVLCAQYHLPLGNPYYHYERSLLDKLHTKALALSVPATHPKVLMF